jgi:Uma2 family endonuclease
MAISERTMTLDEFLRLPEEKPSLEYIDRVVTQKGSPKSDHGWCQGQLAAWCNEIGVPAKLAAAFTETRATFGTWSPVPDVVVYRWDRIPRRPDGRPEPDLFVPPDIAIEIASPGQGRRQLFERCQWFVEHGVEITLLVETNRETITVFRAGQEPRTYRGDERVDLDSVLPGLELTPRRLFDSLRLV